MGGYNKITCINILIVKIFFLGIVAVIFQFYSRKIL